jgi:DNA-binding beta-propeller fold protein YncE
MSRSRPAGVWFRVLSVIFIAAWMRIDAAPINDPPNPYRAVENWAQLPPGIQWGPVINVAPDARGNIWVFHRSDPAVLEFDSSGKLLKSFGVGMFVQAHGLALDGEGNVWVTDAQGKDGKGQQVFKFSPDGKVLMTLGKAGVAGAGSDTFNGPSGVVVARNGDIFVADGHGGNTNARIVKFSKDGKFVKAWGMKGPGPGEFDTPHSIAMDSKERLFVADRVNNRIQIFDREGTFIDQWKQFGRPSGIFIAKNDTLYSVDSQSDEKTNPGVKRGIRIGSAKTGVVTAFIPDLSADPQIALAEGVCADAKGNIYAAGVSSMALHKFVRNQSAPGR